MTNRASHSSYVRGLGYGPHLCSHICFVLRLRIRTFPFPFSSHAGQPTSFHSSSDNRTILTLLLTHRVHLFFFPSFACGTYFLRPFTSLFSTLSSRTDSTRACNPAVALVLVREYPGQVDDTRDDTRRELLVYVARVLYMVCIVASSILWSVAKFVQEQEGNGPSVSRKHYIQGKARSATAVVPQRSLVGIWVDAGYGLLRHQWTRVLIPIIIP